jgi:hypothetical protein
MVIRRRGKKERDYAMPGKKSLRLCSPFAIRVLALLSAFQLVRNNAKKKQPPKSSQIESHQQRD